MPSDEQAPLSEMLKHLDTLKTPEEKQAYVLEHFAKQKEKETTPQVIGLSEHGAIEGAEPCL